MDGTAVASLTHCRVVGGCARTDVKAVFNSRTASVRLRTRRT